jgi:hypothetical protein
MSQTPELLPGRPVSQLITILLARTGAVCPVRCPRPGIHNIVTASTPRYIA